MLGIKINRLEFSNTDHSKVNFFSDKAEPLVRHQRPAQGSGWQLRHLQRQGAPDPQLPEGLQQYFLGARKRT